VGGQPDVELVQLNSFGCGPDAVAVDEVAGILREHGKNHTLIRIDEIDSIGSAKLRLRSLLEALAERDRRAGRRPVVRRTTRLFQPSDRRKTIIVPEFSSFCSPPIVRPLRDMGYDVEVLPRADRESVDVGLTCTNNEVCYPGIIVIGDIVKALRSGRYEPDEVVVGAWETGGQCRASSISCLIKKALAEAGYDDIPVVTLSTRMQPVNPQPGFKLNIASYLHKAALGMVYTDALSALYHATAVRESRVGDAWALVSRYLTAFDQGALPLTRSALLESLHAEQPLREPDLVRG